MITTGIFCSKPHCFTRRGEKAGSNFQLKTVQVEQGTCCTMLPNFKNTTAEFVLVRGDLS